MFFKTSLLSTPDKLLIQATKVLKKEGQEFSRTLPSGTTVKYIRGENTNARGFGEKYCLYKEVTKPDGFRTVTNAHVIRDDVFVNEVFFIEPNGWCPDVMYYNKYFNIRQPGITNYYTIGQPNGIDRRPDILKNLLRKKVRPFNEASEYRSDKAWEMHCRICYESDPKGFAQYKKYSDCGYTDEEYNYHTFSKDYKGSKTSGSSRKTQSESNQQRTREYEQSQRGNNSGGSQGSSYSHGSRYSEGSGSSQGSRFSGSTSSSTGKITKEQFVNYMSDQFSHLKSKAEVDPKTLKGAEIRNLAKLFGIDETSMRNFDKATKRKLILKYHPDTNNGDDMSIKIFQIVNKLKAA